MFLIAMTFHKKAERPTENHVSVFFNDELEVLRFDLFSIC